MPARYPIYSAASNKMSVSRSGMSTITSWPHGASYMRQAGSALRVAKAASKADRAAERRAEAARKKEEAARKKREAEIRKAEEEVIQLGGEGSGSVAVASGPLGMLLIVPDAVACFHQQFPRVRIRILEGRDVSDADTRATAPVAVVNETFARRYFGTASAVGRRFTGWGRPITIVGVAADSKYHQLTEAAQRP